MSGKHTARTLVSPTVLIRFTSPSRAAAIQCSDRLHLNDVKNSPSANKDGGGVFLLTYTKHQLKTIQKIEHNLAYMDYAMIFCL